MGDRPGPAYPFPAAADLWTVAARLRAAGMSARVAEWAAVAMAIDDVMFGLENAAEEPGSAAVDVTDGVDQMDESAVRGQVNRFLAEACHIARGRLAEAAEDDARQLLGGTPARVGEPPPTG